MIPTISIKEATLSLGFKDQRTTIRFCLRNGIKIFAERGRKKYLLRSELEYALNKPLIQYLKERYKERWVEVFKALSSKDVFDGVITLEIESVVNNNSCAGNKKQRKAASSENSKQNNIVYGPYASKLLKDISDADLHHL